MRAAAKESGENMENVNADGAKPVTGRGAKAGCLAALLLGLVALLAVCFVWRGAVSFRDLVPSDCSVYVEIERPVANIERLRQIPALGEYGDGALPLELKHQLFEAAVLAVSPAGKEDARKLLVRNLLEAADRLAFAKRVGAGGTEWIVFLHFADAAPTEQALRDSLFLDQTRAVLGDISADSFIGAGGARVFYRLDRGLLLLTQSEKLLRYALGSGESMPPMSAIRGMDGPAAPLLALAEVSVSDTSKAKDNESGVKAVITAKLVGDGLEAKLSFVGAGAPGGRGAMHYLGWIVGVPAAVIGAALLLLLGGTLGLAGYFRLLQWWKGEATPPAATPAEVPQRLREDLGTETEEKSAAPAGTEEEGHGEWEMD